MGRAVASNYKALEDLRGPLTPFCSYPFDVLCDLTCGLHLHNHLSVLGIIRDPMHYTLYYNNVQ